MAALSPLVALFQAGAVDRDLRRLAARGGLMPRERDEVSLLLILADDPDPVIAEQARASLARVPEALRREAMLDGAPAEAIGPVHQEDPGTGEIPESVRARVSGMGVPERLVLALRGGRAERAVLATDASKAVALAVLSNPGVSEAEIEGLARLSQAHEDVLRAIAGQRGWVRRYGVVVALVRNPRTPAAIALNLLPRLHDRDLRLVSTDRNIPDVVRVTARRKVVAG